MPPSGPANQCPFVLRAPRAEEGRAPTATPPRESRRRIALFVRVSREWRAVWGKPTMMSWSVPRNSTNTPSAWIRGCFLFWDKPDVHPPTLSLHHVNERPDCLTTLNSRLLSLTPPETPPRAALACRPEQLLRHARRASSANRHRSGSRQYHRRRRPSALSVAKPSTVRGCALTAQRGNCIVQVEFVHPQITPPGRAAGIGPLPGHLGEGWERNGGLGHEFAMLSADLGFRV